MSKSKQIIEQFFKCDYPEDLRKKFALWLIHSQAAGEKEQELYRQWEGIPAETNPSTEAAYRRVAEQLGFSGRKKIRAFYLRIVQTAACILIPILSVAAAYLYVQSHTPQDFTFVDCYVPNGEIREIRLPDSSAVHMNSGSLLFYPKVFTGKNRLVYLSGEAKFTVNPDKKKPFIVQTKEMNVEALGTVFNVSSYPDHPYTTATLVEGKVKVEVLANGETFVLNPREQVVYNNETGFSERKQSRLEYVLAWEKGQVVFQSASLYTIIREIERRYGVTVYFNASKLKDEKVTVKFIHEETLEEILYTLQQIVTGFHYKVEKDRIYIY